MKHIVEFGVVLMTADKKCILRGRANTKYELCLTSEKSKKLVRFFRSANIAEVDYLESKIFLSEQVKEYYGTDKERYSIVGDKIPPLVAVKACKDISFEA